LFWTPDSLGKRHEEDESKGCFTFDLRAYCVTHMIEGKKDPETHSNPAMVRRVYDRRRVRKVSPLKQCMASIRGHATIWRFSKTLESRMNIEHPTAFFDSGFTPHERDDWLVLMERES